MSRAKSLAMAGMIACVMCAPARSWAQQPARTAEMGNQEYQRKGDDGLVREVRLALVCYGGSSLAIYMHGNTKELLRLVQASKALELDAKADNVLKNAVLYHKNNEPPTPGALGRTLTGSTRQWYERLLELWDTDPKKVRTRVVIDVIAGTSAGGINGVILAKALAHDVSVDELTELWMTKASLARLTNHYFGLLRVLAGRAPVDGDALLGWLYRALATMDHPDAGRHSLLPKGDRLDLFVTATDRYGYPQNLVVGDPDAAAEARHRHVLHFVYPGSKRGCGPEVKDDYFCPYWTPALAFAARASSSIPGVFPPLGLPHALQTTGPAPAGLQHDVVTGLFRNYQLQQPGQDDSYLEKTFFVDGGVLDNHPFDSAIAEVFERPQEQEVRRFLVYLQPDPGEFPTAPPGKEPRLLPTIWAGLSGLPSGQPILDSLTDVDEHNVLLDRLRDIVRAEEAAVRVKERGDGDGSSDCSHPADLPVAERFACVMDPATGNFEAKLAKATVSDLAELRQKLERAAREGTNELADRSYVSVRVHSVLDQLVAVISSEKACNYPPESTHRALVRKIVEQWAAQRQLIGTPDKPGGDLEAQLDFLEKLDVGYLRRQLRFVVDWVNVQYEGDGKGNLPDTTRRRKLDAVKTAASREIDEAHLLRRRCRPGIGRRRREGEVTVWRPSSLEGGGEAEPVSRPAGGVLRWRSAEARRPQHLAGQVGEPASGAAEESPQGILRGLPETDRRRESERQLDRRRPARDPGALPGVPLLGPADLSASRVCGHRGIRPGQGVPPQPRRRGSSQGWPGEQEAGGCEDRPLRRLPLAAGSGG